MKPQMKMLRCVFSLVTFNLKELSFFVKGFCFSENLFQS